MMHIFSLLSYVGLTLALVPGNHQTTIRSLNTVKNHAILAPENFKPFKPITSGNVHDWFVYNKRQKLNMLQFDDLLSAILGKFYKQKQIHLPRKTIEGITTEKTSTSHLLNFLFNENSYKLKKKEKKKTTVPVSATRRRVIWNSNKPYSSATMCLQTLASMKTTPSKSRFDEITLNRNVDLLKLCRYRFISNTTYDSEAPVATTVKSLDKRNRISLNIGQDKKELQKQHQYPVSAIVAAGSNIASQFMLRSARANRQYDVPQIECPLSEDGMERFACPTADRMGRYRCIDDHVLCDGFIDCPMGEDEDRQTCMFYKTTKAHLDVLADALLRWARGR